MNFVKRLINLLRNKNGMQILKAIAEGYVFRFFIKNSCFGIYTGTRKSDGFSREFNLNGLDKKIAKELVKMYCAHYFDLLGSGWTLVSYHNNALGLEGYKYDAITLYTDREGRFLNKLITPGNLKRSKKIWQLIEGQYQGIDWQKDFKVGWRWDNKDFYYPRRWPDRGADLKVPWELGRLQHFPRMALLAMILPEKKEQLYREFRNQALDFIALNPVGWGVNYMCSMDVSIRVANMVLAWKLWQTIDNENKAGLFEDIYFEYIYKQCYFIYHNLEWKPFHGGSGGNHYMADIVGLIWGTSALKLKRNVRRWNNFAINEFFKEIKKQYYEEGTNKEASAGYHRLTTEMIAYTIALLDHQGIEMDQDIYNILAGAGYYLAAITRPDDAFTQIGDNDSGRFFRLSFHGEFMLSEHICRKYYNLKGYVFNLSDLYFDEYMNETGGVLAAVNAIVDDAELSKICLTPSFGYEFEYSLIQNLVYRRKKAKVTHNKFNRFTAPNALQYSHRERYYFKESIDPENLQLIEFPAVGILVLRSAELFLVLNLTEIPPDGRIGHTHNDKLGVEIFDRNTCLIEDGGTYLYTPLPEKQFEDKSVKNHLNITICGMEQDNISKQDRWYIKVNETKCYLAEASREKIVAYIKYRDIVHLREISIYETHIDITDRANRDIVEVNEAKRITAGYGKWLKK
ncbi:MAG: hypothetical protein HDR71_02130 [Lachnospiraceae bacterium]|nr:hypothetical protein [Lachnospiraceae bacterium]